VDVAHPQFDAAWWPGLNNGQHDWRVPTAGELDVLSKNRASIGGFKPRRFGSRRVVLVLQRAHQPRVGAALQ
jgi:hypothetical protein